jgi:hypothetical protein
VDRGGSTDKNRGLWTSRCCPSRAALLPAHPH